MAKVVLTVLKRSLKSKKVKMKRLIFKLLTIAVILPVVFVGCKKRQITMTTEKTVVRIGMGGSGFATIDWGDGTLKETKSFDNDGWLEFDYEYENDTLHTITITGDNMVVMQRSGDAPSNLVIEKGKKHHCHYGTPYGDFMVGITADDVICNLNDTGGDLYLKYTIDINSTLMSENEMYIDFKDIEE